MKYRGYYIDNIIFNSKQDIDNHIKKQAIESYKRAIRIFIKKGDMESSVYADEKAEYLVKECGMTWDQIEEIEFKAASY